MSDELKKQLSELIKNSKALQSLPAEDREMRVNMMLNADDAAMQQFIDVLMNESRQYKAIEDEMTESGAEIQNLISQANQLEKEATAIERKDMEASVQESEKAQAEEMLKKLDEINPS